MIKQVLNLTLLKFTFCKSEYLPTASRKSPSNFSTCNCCCFPNFLVNAFNLFTSLLVADAIWFVLNCVTCLLKCHFQKKKTEPKAKIFLHIISDSLIVSVCADGLECIFQCLITRVDCVDIGNDILRQRVKFCWITCGSTKIHLSGIRHWSIIGLGTIHFVCVVYLHALFISQHTMKSSVEELLMVVESVDQLIWEIHCLYCGIMSFT